MNSRSAHWIAIPARFARKKTLSVNRSTFRVTNPATGPLYVEGAMPGDVLVVDVLSVEVADKGAVTTIPNIGPLYDRCVDRTRILP